MTGSSPRARGTRGFRRRADTRARVIPACAGNTPHLLRQRSGMPGHPRVRGEHIAMASKDLHNNGSSPRARGTLAITAESTGQSRVIPACAGNTHEQASMPVVPAGHPRVRGEHADLRDFVVAHGGSSPRARGTRLGSQMADFLGRVIPACAGNTRPSIRPRRTLSGHPRVRGEHGDQPLGIVRMTGSSPRARGTHEPVEFAIHALRVIPACAGNTAAGRRKFEQITGHPRVRGEHGGAASCVALCNGSSPRARGTPSGRENGPGANRVIPACAGNTLTGEPCSKTIFTMSTRAPAISGSTLGPDPRTAQRNGRRPVRPEVRVLSRADAGFVAVASGRKRTSFIPSSSTGTRRLDPQVSNSKPASVAADHAITALPSPIRSTISAQIASRTLRE